MIEKEEKTECETRRQGERLQRREQSQHECMHIPLDRHVILCFLKLLTEKKVILRYRQHIMHTRSKIVLRVLPTAIIAKLRTKLTKYSYCK